MKTNIKVTLQIPENAYPWWWWGGGASIPINSISLFFPYFQFNFLLVPVKVGGEGENSMLIQLFVCKYKKNLYCASPRCYVSVYIRVIYSSILYILEI